MSKQVTGPDAMLAAHVAYELDLYTPAKVATTLRQEVVALYAWLHTVQVGDLVQPDHLLGFLRRNVVERPLPADMVEFLRENAVIILELIQDEQVRLEAVLPHHVFEQAVAQLAAMQDARRQITHQIITSSVYSRLISNVLYHGIKSFLVSENGVTRTIPGAASFLRMGQNALNAAAPQLEKNVDKQLLTFINDNIQQLIADSEAFLNRTLDDALIRKVGDELWQTIKDTPLANLAAGLDKSAVGGWSAIIQDFWLHLRATPLFDDILQSIVRSFFLRYGKRSVADLLTLLGLSEKAALQELERMAEPLARQALASGYLEARIRARLEPFYVGYLAAHTVTGGRL